MYCPDNLFTSLAISLYYYDLVRLADAQRPIRIHDYAVDPVCVGQQSPTVHILHPSSLRLFLRMRLQVAIY